MSATKRRIRSIERKIQPEESIKIYVVLIDPDNPDLVNYNGETMTRAEFDRRYPSRGKPIVVSYDNAAEGDEP